MLFIVFPLIYDFIIKRNAIHLLWCELPELLLFDHALSTCKLWNCLSIPEFCQREEMKYKYHLYTLQFQYLLHFFQPLPPLFSFHFLSLPFSLLTTNPGIQTPSKSEASIPYMVLSSLPIWFGPDLGPAGILELERLLLTFHSFTPILPTSLPSSILS